MARRGGFTWTAELEMHVLDSLSEYPPIGIHRYTNLLNIRMLVRRRTGIDIPDGEIAAYLKKLFHWEEMNGPEDDVLRKQTAPFCLTNEYKDAMEMRAPLTRQEQGQMEPLATL